MPLVHFDRQVVVDFFSIPVEEAEEALKHIEHKDPIDVQDEFSGDDIKAIAMTYAHRKYPSATDKDKVSFGSQVSYGVCGMYTGVAHYIKEQKAERVFEEFKKAYGVEPGDEGPEIREDISAADFTRASILILEGMILHPESANSGSVDGSIRLIEENGSLFDSSRRESIQKTLSGLKNLNL
jgi:hypothetical protein